MLARATLLSILLNLTFWKLESPAQVPAIKLSTGGEVRFPGYYTDCRLALFDQLNIEDSAFYNVAGCTTLSGGIIYIHLITIESNDGVIS